MPSTASKQGKCLPGIIKTSSQQMCDWKKEPNNYTKAIWVKLLFFNLQGNWTPSSMTLLCWITWLAKTKAVSWWLLAVAKCLLPLVMALRCRRIHAGNGPSTWPCSSSWLMVTFFIHIQRMTSFIIINYLTIIVHLHCSHELEFKTVVLKDTIKNKKAVWTLCHSYREQKDDKLKGISRTAKAILILNICLALS